MFLKNVEKNCISFSKLLNKFVFLSYFTYKYYFIFLLDVSKKGLHL